jgi:hypothetical protein
LKYVSYIILNELQDSLVRKYVTFMMLKPTFPYSNYMPKTLWQGHCMTAITMPAFAR